MMTKEEIIKAIEEGIEKLSEEPSEVQIAFENGCKYTLNNFQWLFEHCDDLQQRIDKLREKINFYKTTEWGFKSYSILELFDEILGGKNESKHDSKGDKC